MNIVLSVVRSIYICIHILTEKIGNKRDKSYFCCIFVTSRCATFSYERNHTMIASIERVRVAAFSLYDAIKLGPIDDSFLVENTNGSQRTSRIRRRSSIVLLYSLTNVNA